MGHLLYGYVIVMLSNEVHPVCWTIPHCVLVLKLIGIAYNLYDGTKDQIELNEEQKETCISKLPSFFEVMGYSYHFGTVLAGPQFSFMRYQKFVSGKLFLWPASPGSFIAGVSRLCLGIGYASLYSILNRWYPLSYIIGSEYDEKGFLAKLFIMTIIGKVALWRYIVVWLFAEGSCIMTGISYKLKKRNGSVDWSGVNNVHLLQFESAFSLQSLVYAFNVNTNYWIKCYVYKRLKWLGNRQLSFVLSLLFISLWHGIWPGYLFNFSFEVIVLTAEKQLVSVARHRLGIVMNELPWLLYLPIVVVLYLLMNVILMYPVMMFMLLSWSACWKFMKSVYFFGHLAAGIWFILYYTILKPSHTKQY